MSNYEVILLDLDGTLTDPQLGITNSIQYALKKMNIIEDDLAKLISFIGPPLAESFQKFYQLDDDKAWQAVIYYREYFSEKGIYENEVYPGVAQLLEKLFRQGKLLILATSKPTVFAQKIIEHFGLAEYFTKTVGSNLDGTLVTKTDVIRYALSDFAQIPKDVIVMVGDREHDIIGARNNGIDCIAVSYGYGAETELKKANPANIVNSIEDLAEMLCK